jgi:hypothetical protein
MSLASPTMLKIRKTPRRNATSDFRGVSRKKDLVRLIGHRAWRESYHKEPNRAAGARSAWLPTRFACRVYRSRVEDEGGLIVGQHK